MPCVGHLTDSRLRLNTGSMSQTESGNVPMFAKRSGPVIVDGVLSLPKSMEFYSWTPWSWTLLKKPPVAQLLTNFPAVYGTQRFITVFTRVSHWSLSWTRSIQSTPPHRISLKSILILFSHLYIVFPSVSFLLAFLPTPYMHSCWAPPPPPHNSPTKKEKNWTRVCLRLL
jgi:hypothetical protein